MTKLHSVGGFTQEVDDTCNIEIETARVIFYDGTIAFAAIRHGFSNINVADHKARLAGGICSSCILASAPEMLKSVVQEAPCNRRQKCRSDRLRFLALLWKFILVEAPLMSSYSQHTTIATPRPCSSTLYASPSHTSSATSLTSVNFFFIPSMSIKFPSA